MGEKSIGATCKFVVQSSKQWAQGSREIELATQYDEALSKEDRAFAKSTPSGKMTILIDNPNVFDIFTPGNVVYVNVVVAA